jgi:hypothetical protein
MSNPNTLNYNKLTEEFFNKIHAILADPKQLRTAISNSEIFKNLNKVTDNSSSEHIFESLRKLKIDEQALEIKQTELLSDISINERSSKKVLTGYYNLSANAQENMQHMSELTRIAIFSAILAASFEIEPELSRARFEADEASQLNIQASVNSFRLHLEKHALENLFSMFTYSNSNKLAAEILKKIDILYNELEQAKPNSEASAKIKNNIAELTDFHRVVATGYKQDGSTVTLADKFKLVGSEFTNTSEALTKQSVKNLNSTSASQIMKNLVFVIMAFIPQFINFAATGGNHFLLFNPTKGAQDELRKLNSPEVANVGADFTIPTPASATAA